ncbi:MAG: alanine--tRNA ligase [Acidimicrobiales bacterium]|nr:alanine--tRNA ligase [Acidimicrobiales bacterium]
MDANQLRRAFTDYFVARGHTHVPSSGLIPHHPAAPLFTVAGMVQFIPYFLGEELPPYSRATSVQKSFRTPDIDIIGTTTRHLTFFEMLGNFSFGDYFKQEAIPFAWEVVTEVFGLDPDRLWVTCFTDDDEAADIWRDAVGVRPDRIQRLGDDNWWEMAKGGAGPCGPCSEIYVDKGAEWGEAGGPAAGGPERFVEIWNLVFMQFNRLADGSLSDLPRKNIDTGAGLERIVPILQGHASVFETDVLRPIIAAAEGVTAERYGRHERTDVTLRILADHGRAMTFLVNDGVFPSNEDRGYVLRRIIRRAVRHAYLLGTERPVTPALVTATVDVMGDAYPELVKNHDFIAGVVGREEERFRHSLRSGLAILDDQLAGRTGGSVIEGELAFRLHDTFGFPVEVTQEIAEERGVAVDMAGFERAMAEQRRRAKDARKGGAGDAARADAYRELVEQFGTTEFTGYTEVTSPARVLAVLEAPDAGEGGLVEVFLDRTPFYAEGGGQVGDTGTITTPTGTVEVLDTRAALPGLHQHLGRVVEGEVGPGQEAVAAVDAARRDAIRRNHTGTHLLHWALREVLGDHVKQAGSLVAPDRLRFDFSHYEAVTPDELARIEDLVNAEVLANRPVRAFETTREHAADLGAIAFFGEKYGETVRVLEAGPHSVELCGGTHVHALGDIGPVRVVHEGSIGSNLRRIEAVTGFATVERLRAAEDRAARAGQLLGVPPEQLVEGVERRLEEVRALRDELKALRRAQTGARAAELAGTAVDGVVVARVDGTARDELRDLALAVRDHAGVRAVVLGGEPEGGGAALVSAVAPASGLHAADLIAEAARTVQGGGGKQPDLAVAGGKDPARLAEALDQARAAAGVGSR